MNTGTSSHSLKSQLIGAYTLSIQNAKCLQKCLLVPNRANIKTAHLKIFC